MTPKAATSILIHAVFFSAALSAQSTVRVAFRYSPASSGAVRAYVPGTFNNWGPNVSGRIAVDAPSLMSFDDSLGCYVKQVPLDAGKRYEYKFHEHANASGSQCQWFTDPLNPLVNTSDNNNSILRTEKAMLFQIVPKNGAVVRESRPTLVAGVFAADGDSILDDRSTLRLDGAVVSTFEGLIRRDLSVLKCRLPEMCSGIHSVSLHVATKNGESAADSTVFTMVTGDVFFMTPSIDTVLADRKTIRWYVGMGHTKLNSVTLKQVGRYPLVFPGETNKEYEYTVDLCAGGNQYVVSVLEPSGCITESDTLRLFYPEPQKPEPEIVFESNGGSIRVTGKGHDPQNGAVAFFWSVQKTNPSRLEGIDGRTDAAFDIDRPGIPGDYALHLAATDGDGNSSTTVNFFTLLPDSSIVLPGGETVPSWVHDARIYSLFVKSYTSAGTLQAAADSLEHVRAMGFNVVWVLPVMDVEGELDRNTNIGYNIADFYNVDPGYGTNADFKAFVEKAHALGLRVILDVTPNHSSRSHSIAQDVRSKKKYSRYYDFYQHAVIPHETNGLGQSLSSDGIVYYTGFSDALLNWNWDDGEARRYMIDVYTHWLREYDIDGFRLDVYWGPHRRYGSEHFDLPLRAALRAAKADILLLGETSGTGTGTDDQYADRCGGMDMGYDWILGGTLANFPSISSLEGALQNGGYRPGPNSFFLRFLENHDELRAAKRYDSIEKTMPVSAAVFLATGIPLLYQGQEVGMGFQMNGSKDALARSVVLWRNPPAAVLIPHYQKLAQIRAQFPAFRRQREDSNGDHAIRSDDKDVQPMLAASCADIYAFGRPHVDQNGIVVANFSAEPKLFQLTLNLEGWAEFSRPFGAGRKYHVNNLYGNTSAEVAGAELGVMKLTLNAYGVAVYTISTREEHVRLPDIAVRVEKTENAGMPAAARLIGLFPNPFNPQTTIRYDLAGHARVSLEIIDMMGRRIAVLVRGDRPPGEHEAVWDGRAEDGRHAPSGVYFCRLRAGEAVETEKMMLIR